MTNTMTTGAQYKRAETRKAVQQYRELKAIQQRMPQNKQWEMGADLNAAKARALVEIECETYGV